MTRIFDADWSRRDCLKLGLASAFGLSFSGWLPTVARAQAAKPARSCILLWMNGGPSQLDTFDPKPGVPTGGPFAAIETSAPGIRFGEHLPGLARHAHHMAIVRTMTSKEGDHGRAAFLSRTGYVQQGPVRYPTLGSLVSKELGKLDAMIPNYVSISPFTGFSDAAFGPGFLGPSYAPLTVGGSNVFRIQAGDEQLRVDNLTPDNGLSTDTVRDRFALLDAVQNDFGRRHRALSADTHRANFALASRMVLSKIESVFDLGKEPEALRDSYGRNRFGQGCLLARRLVERGVPFVEVALTGVPGADNAWDTHQNNFDQVKNLCNVLDPAFATLMSDLESRGLLGSTLVVWMGEFGRTPTINGFTGRDHYPNAYSVVLAGGGVKGGIAYGGTGITGHEAEGKLVKLPEFIATVCSALGIDPKKENMSDEGRPIRIVDKGIGPIRELLA